MCHDGGDDSPLSAASKPLVPHADTKSEGTEGTGDTGGAPSEGTGGEPSSCMTAPLTAWLVFFLLGLAPWLIVNGVFCEVALLVVALPEGQNIAATLGVVVQLGNISPVAYMFLWRRNIVTTACAMWGMIGMSVLACFLLGFFWKTTINIPGWSNASPDGATTSHALPLFALVFLGGMIGCTSKVVLFPFSSDYTDTLTAAVSTGMGMIGLMGVVLGAIQGLSEDGKATHPRFGFAVFSYILLGLSALAGCSYLVALRPAFIHRWVQPTDAIPLVQGPIRRSSKERRDVTPPPSTLDPEERRPSMMSFGDSVADERKRRAMMRRASVEGSFISFEGSFFSSDHTDQGDYDSEDPEVAPPKIGPPVRDSEEDVDRALSEAAW